MTIKDKLILYIYKKGDEIETDYENHQHFIRFHKVDEVDFLEMIIRKVRRDTYNEILADFMAILSMSDKYQFGENKK